MLLFLIRIRWQTVNCSRLLAAASSILCMSVPACRDSLCRRGKQPALTSMGLCLRAGRLTSTGSASLVMLKATAITSAVNVQLP